MMFDYDIDLVSGRYAIDAKSIMGIFSLDLSKPIKLQAHTEDPEALIKAIQKYIICLKPESPVAFWRHSASERDTRRQLRGI